MQAIENDPHLQVMAERNRAHDQIIRLRAILGSFKENLKSAIEITQRELESQCEFFSKGHGGRERRLGLALCLQEQARLEAYKHSLQRLEQIEASTR